MLAQRNLVVVRHEKGAIILTFAMMLLFLIGFAGIAIDLGRLFIVRTELQTALDSCALAAAQELDGQSNSTTRARNAGLVAGNVNNVNLQSPTWDGHAKLTANEISFRDKDYTPTESGASAQYVQCQHTQVGVKAWLLPVMTAFSGTSYPSTNAVMGSAVATRGHAQSSCPVPVALIARTATPPDYGFAKGEWITVYGSKAANSGEMGWYNLDGSHDASETEKELQEAGMCGIAVGTTIGSALRTYGAKTKVDQVWNTRFGIYKHNDLPVTASNYDGPATNHPDLTGYAYTTSNWTAGRNAYDGNPISGKDDPTAESFIVKRSKLASFDDTGSSLDDGSLIAFKDKNRLNSFKSPVATAGLTGDHGKYGYDRRIVIIPVLVTGNKVADFACMLMLAPLTGPQDDTKMEYRGNAGAADSPCTTNGLAGGSAGPLVPVLVR
jgi:Flp pilus assembly protein TadG